MVFKNAVDINHRGKNIAIWTNFQIPWCLLMQKENELANLQTWRGKNWLFLGKPEISRRVGQHHSSYWWAITWTEQMHEKRLRGNLWLRGMLVGWKNSLLLFACANGATSTFWRTRSPTSWTRFRRTSSGRIMCALSGGKLFDECAY